MKLFSNIMNNEDGATAIEYGLIAALIAVALITVLGTMSDSLQGTFTKISNDLNTANSG